MMKIELKSKKREETGRKVGKYRSEGLVPAVSYGRKIAPVNLWIDALELKKLYTKVGENTIIELDIEGGKKANVLIHDIQSDPLSGDFSHVDFFQIKMDEKIETDIPLNFVGVSPAVKEQGGILVKGTDSLPVRCLPADLPGKIDVDLSSLGTFDDRIDVGDLDISDKIEVLIEKGTPIASVSPPRSEEELAGLDDKIEEDVSAVEGVEKEVVESGETAEEGANEKKNKEEK